MKIGALIPVRLGSERLPRKHLKEIQGKPVLHYLLERLYSSKYIDPENVIVCTTMESENDELLDIVSQYGAKVFRGSKDDIIERFYQAVNLYNFEIIAEICGDDPCFDPGYLDLCFEKLLSDSSLDIVYSTGLPVGASSAVFRKQALDIVYRSYTTSKNDTGYMWYFTKTGLCNVFEVRPVSDEDVDNEARLTLDYVEDFELINSLFEKLYLPGKIFSVREIVSLFKSEPQLRAINSNLKAQYIARTNELAQLEFRKNGMIQTIKVDV